MKKILVIIILFSFTQNLKAEYKGTYLSITLELNNGKKIKGFVSTIFDKKDDDFFISNLTKNNVITFFKNRIIYEYTFETDDKVKVYKLVDKSEINADLISKITITEKVEFSYLTKIVNDLKMNDLEWLNTKPIESHKISRYWCDYQIFIHNKTPEIMKLIKELKLLNKKIENTGLIEKEENKYEEIITKLIDKFNGEKAIVISFCSC